MHSPHRCWTIMALLTAMLLPTAVRAADDAEDAEKGFVPIFDGKTLDGWDGDPKLWSVEDGAITGRTSDDDPIKQNSFCIWRGGKVDDFVLRFEIKLEGGNTGVQYRSFEVPEAGKWVMGGYQGDFESGVNYSGILYGERYRGILAKRGQKTVIGDDHKPTVVGEIGDSADMQKYVKMGDWNEYEISAQGYTFIHKINGHTMIECVDEDEAERRREGLIGLQVHKGPAMKVQFRNIRLKKLDDAKKVALVYGGPSHGFMSHEHEAGCMLLADLLNSYVPGVVAEVHDAPF